MLANSKVIPKLAEQLVALLPVVLSTNAKMLSRARQLLVEKLVHPPPAANDDEKAWPTYERSMRKGLSPEELNRILLLLYSSRSTKELILSHLPLLTAHISSHVQTYLQNFAWNVLPIAIGKNSGLKPSPSPTMAAVRALLGCFKEGDFKIDEKNKKFGKQTPVVCEAAPQLQVIELARIQIQMFVNPNSEFQKKTKIRSDDREAFELFLNDTRFFEDLLRLPDVLDALYDQSSLFFKESMLAIANVSFFPVTTSLPVILTDYIMKNYQRQELGNAVYYPLTIYDDAAACSLRVLKSRFLYEEIKAEAQICLMSVLRLISDSAFHPIRRMCALRLVSRSACTELAKVPGIGEAPFLETASASRLRGVLEQNQLSLLGCIVDTQAIIAERLNELMSQEIAKVFGLTDKHGALVAIGISRLLEILHATNRIFLSAGLPMMPFEDQVSRILSTDTPNSLQSALLANLATHFTDTVVTDYYLMTYPLRLVPAAAPRIGYANLFVGNVGLIMENLLMPASAFITVEHLRDVFWRLHDGAISILQDQVTSYIPVVFEDFIKVYGAVSSRLTRIADAPISMNSGQVFDRFEGAYRIFAKDQEIIQLYKLLAQLGNILGLSEMMDAALGLKMHTAQQVSSFLLGVHPNKPAPASKDAELYTLFDKRFQEIRQTLTFFYPNPTPDQVLQPFLCNALMQLTGLVVENMATFDETSGNLLDVRSLNGFASRWSVLEFLFCLLESTRKVDADEEAEGGEDQNAGGSISQYGEGVLLSVAVILCAVEQKPLYRLLAIGERIKAHQLVDFNALSEDRVKRFLAVSDVVTASLRCAVASFEPPISRILHH
jgi:hypothetical protein